MRVKINWLYVFIAYLSLAALGFLDTVRGPYFPDIIKDLNLTDSRAALFFVVTSLVAAISGRVTMWIVYYIGLIPLVRVGHLSMGLGGAFIARSESLLMLLNGAFVFGIGFGFVNVTQNVLVLRGATASRRRQLLSGLHSVYALAAILAPVLVSFFYSLSWDWRRGFYFASGLCMLALLSTFFAPSEKELKPERKEWVSLKAAFLVTMLLSFYVLAELLLGTRFVLYLRREFLVSPEAASQALALFYCLLLIGRLIFSSLNLPKVKSENVIAVCVLITFLLFTLGLIYSPYILILCGLSMAPIFGVALDLIAERFHERADQAIATCLSWNAILIVIMHYLVGLITETSGIKFAMWLGPIFLLVSFLTAIFIKQKATNNL